MAMWKISWMLSCYHLCYRRCIINHSSQEEGETAVPGLKKDGENQSRLGTDIHRHKNGKES